MGCATSCGPNSYDGQLGDFDPDKLLVDYSASVEDVYSSFVVAVVSATNRIDILGFCNQDERVYVRRSWTPDWTSRFRPGILMCDVRSSSTWEAESWTFNVSRGYECKALFAPDLSALTVSGITWDEIIEVSSNELVRPGQQEIFRRSCLSILNLSKGINERTNVYTSSDELDLILLHVLMLGQLIVREGKETNPFWIESFREWLSGEEQKQYAEAGSTNADAEVDKSGVEEDIAIGSTDDVEGMSDNVEETATGSTDDGDVGLSEEEKTAIGSIGDIDDVDTLLSVLEETSYRLGVLKDVSRIMESKRLENENDTTFQDFLRQIGGLPNKVDKVILTKDGYIGRCRNTVGVGDIVCVLFGCAMPMVLRPHFLGYATMGSLYLDKIYYELIGEAYLHGIMHGEAMAALQNGQKEVHEYELH